MSKIPHNDISKIKKAASFFKVYLKDQQYLYVCKDQDGNYRFLECIYDCKQFKHLSGIETLPFFDSYTFFAMCTNNTKMLYKDIFKYKPLTGQKLHVLVKAIKNLKAPSKIGLLDTNSVTFVDSDYIIGQDNYAIGIKMVSNYNNTKYHNLIGIPNTTLNRNFDCIASEQYDVLAVLTKDKQNYQYDTMEVIDSSFNIDDIVEYKGYYNRINVNNLQDTETHIKDILKTLGFSVDKVLQDYPPMDYPLNYSKQVKIK